MSGLHTKTKNKRRREEIAMLSVGSFQTVQEQKGINILEGMALSQQRFLGKDVV